MYQNFEQGQLSISRQSLGNKLTLYVFLCGSAST